MATDEEATLAWEQRRREAQAAHLDAKARGARCAEGCYLCEILRNRYGSRR